ncbi:MAG: bacterial Ig-like domain-containing protein [Clostridia bacterium]
MKEVKQNKKIVALITLITLIANMFFPYCSLISYAGVDLDMPYLELANGYDENDKEFEDVIKPDYEDFNVIPVKLYLGGVKAVDGFDVNFSYDSDLLTPVYYKRNKYVQATSIGNAFSSEDNISVVESGEKCSYLFTNESRIRLQATADKLNPNGKVFLGTFYFQISDGYTLNDITSESFKLVKGASGLQDGLEIDYNNVTQWVLGENYFLISGFNTDGKVEITNFEVTNPTKLNYEHGDIIDYVGSVVTISYSDDSKYSESLQKAIEDGKVTVDRTKADVNNSNFVVTAVEDITQNKTININVTDPVNSIKLIASPTNTSYNTGDTIDLTGGIIETKTKSGVTKNINLPDSSVISDTGLADINSSNIQGNKWTTSSGLLAGNQKITLSYTDSNNVTKTTSFTVIVNDSISEIKIKDNPSKTTYKYGDSLELENGKITVLTVGGASFDLSMEDGAVSVTGYNKTPTSMPNNQNLNVSYGGKVAADTISVTVKNYVKEIILTTPNKTIYKYGDAIDLTGGSYNVKYGNDTIGSASNLTLSDLSNYSMNTIGTQNVIVSYTDNDTNSYTYLDTFTQSFTIQVNDYISKMEITNPTDVSFYYGDTFTFDGGSIKAYYASNPTKAIVIPMTETMIRQVDGSAVEMKPDGSLFDLSTQKYKENLEISVTRGGITKTSNYSIDIINTLKSIQIQGTPKTEYNINEPIQTGLSILVTRQTGEIEAIDVENDMISGFNTTTEGEKEVTITYTENGVTKQTSYSITVKDAVTGIGIKTNPNKTQYKYGEELDLTGATISAVKGSGTVEIPVTEDMVSGYDKEKLGEQTIKVTYGGEETTFKVNVKDYVTKIEVVPADVTGKYNDELSQIISANDIKYVVTYAKEGAKTPETLTESMIKTTYNKGTINKQSLKVEYEDEDVNSATKGEKFEATLNVTLSDVVSKITITKPTKTNYNHGEELDLTGGKIEVTTASGLSKEVPIEGSMITENGTTVNMSPSKDDYGENTTVTKILTITYEEGGKKETAGYPIIIVNDVKSITMHQTPKTSYNVNDLLDVTDGEILVTRAVGEPEAKEITKDMVTGFDSTKENTKLTLTVSYIENGITKTTTYDVSVKDIVTGIGIKTNPNKTQYKYGEELDLTGATISAVKGSGTVEIPVTEDMVSGYDKEKLGEQTIKVTYGGEETTFKVNVKDYVTKIEVVPADVTGKYNDELSQIISANDIKYVVTYAKEGAKTPETLTESMIKTTYNKGTINKQSLKVEYEDEDVNSATKGEKFEATLNVTLSDVVSKITITKPTKTNYNHGEELDLTGGKIEVTTASGLSKEVPIEGSMITENGTTVNMSPSKDDYGENTTVTKILTITYEEGGKKETAGYPIIIVNDVKSITMHQTPKTSYNVNDLLDVTDGEILVTRAVGEPEAKEITKDMVTGFDSTKENTKLTLTVSYTENGITKTTTYDVSVKDSVESISIKANPDKTEYNYGEDLDLTGATISVVKGSGTIEIPVTEDMVSGYDKEKLGEQTIKVTYGGEEATFKVTVKDYVKDIILVNPDKTEYQYGESLDLTGGSVQKVMASGAAVAAVPLTDDSVTLSTFNPNQSGIQTIKVTYEGKTKTFDVNVKDTITGIELQGIPETKYKYGEDFKISNLKLNIHKLSGDVTIPVTQDMIKGYEKNKLGSQVVKIEYEGQTITTINVEVIDYVQSVIITPPSKVEYNYGESLNLDGAKITKIMASNPSKPEEIIVTSSMISGYTSTKIGKQNVTITYVDDKTYTKDFVVTVKDTISEISLNDKDFKKIYKYGDNLDLSNLSINVKYNSGKTENIPVTTGMISGYNPQKLGDQELTIIYNEKSLKTSVTIKDYIKDIKLTPPTKNEYKINESLSLAGGSITEVMASGVNENTISLTKNMVSGFDSTTPGIKKITVTYEGFSKIFEVAVINNVNHIEVIPPTKTNYKYGEDLNLAGSSIKVVMEDGTIRNEKITKDMITGYEKTTPGQQMITVTYKDDKQNTYTGYFSVTVGEDYIKEMKFVSPTKKQYIIGDTLDLTGGSITEVYASGKLGNKYNLTKDIVSGFDSTTPGTKTITVTFKDNTYKYTVNVEDRLLGVSIKDLPNKTTYKKGESLDLTGATLNVTKDSGVTVVKITKDMVSGYDSNKEGYQVITVNYGGFDNKFGVYVEKDATPSTPDSDNNQTDNKPGNNQTDNKTDDNQKNNNQGNNQSNSKNNAKRNTSNTIMYVPSNTEDKVEESNQNTQDNILKDEDKKQDSNQEKSKEPEAIGITNNNQNSPTDVMENLKNILNLFAIILALAGISLIIIVLIKRRKNVKIYLEEDGQKVLIGKEKVTKDDRVLDLNKYYKKYNEDEYKVVLSKSISKKLDQKTVNIIIHDKDENFKVDYNNEEYSYRT